MIVGTTTASGATFLAFLGGGYVAGKVVGSFAGLVGVLVAVLGVLCLHKRACAGRGAATSRKRREGVYQLTR